MAFKDESIKDIYDLLRFNNLRVVYCPNDALGLDGPFMEVNEHQIVEILNGNLIEESLTEKEIIEGIDILISGDQNG